MTHALFNSTKKKTKIVANVQYNTIRIFQPASELKIQFQELPIYRGIKQISLQILQLKSIIATFLCNFERAEPARIKLTMLAFISPSNIPPEHQIPYLQTSVFSTLIE